LDGQVTELVALASPTNPTVHFQLSHEMRAGEKIFYDSRGGGYVQLFFQLMPIPAVEAVSVS
jgi:hypothetical protein